MKNLVLSLLLLTVSLAAVFGVCLLVKDYEYRANYITSVNKEYAEALDKLKEEVNVNIENVTELTKEIELKGLTIDDLTRTVTEYKTQVVVLRETVTEYETIIVEKDNTIASKEQEIQTVTQTVVEYRDRIVYLEKDNSDKESEIESLEGSSAEDKARIAELEAEIEANNREIADLCQEIADLEAEISEKNATIASLQDEIAQLEASKNEVEVQIVEKETIIVEKEEIIVEKEAEIQDLNININVLNQTIIELNVKIELLEDAIENDESKTYIEDFLSNKIKLSFLGFYDENNILFSSGYSNATGIVDLKGLYSFNTVTREVVKLYNDGFNYNSVVFPDGNLFLYNTSYCGGVSSLYFNASTLEVVVVDTGYPRYNEVYQLTNGNVIVYNDHLIYEFDYQTLEKHIIEDNSSKPAVYYIRQIAEDTVFIVYPFGNTQKSGVRIYNPIDKSLIESYLDFNLDHSNIYVGTVPSLGNAIIDDNTRAFKVNEGGFAFYYLDTKTFERITTEGTYNYPFVIDGYILQNVNNKVRIYNSKDGQFYETSYTKSLSVNVKSYEGKHIYYYENRNVQKLSNGDYLLDYASNVYFDTVNMDVFDLKPTTIKGVAIYNLKDKFALIDKEISEINILYSNENVSLYDTFTELEDGIFEITSSSDATLSSLYYDSKTQTISEKDPFAYDITLVNATTIDESSFEEESISSEYIGQEVELFITVPMGHYPSQFEVLTLDSNGNETWTSFDCNGGMNGMTRFNCKFVLEESLIINNTLTIRYNNFTSL